MNNPELSVIYVNYNTKKLLADSVNSVFEKTKDINFEIIIVDNSSTDGSVEELGKIFGDKIKIISSPNLGFGHGMNTGIKSAKGKYVFLFNTDTLLINNAIKILYDYMETNPKCAGAGANSYNEKNVPNCSKCFFLKENSSWLRNLFTHNVRRKFLWTYHVYSNKPVKVEYPTFAAILLRKDIFEKTGGFDEDFFMFCEDEELAFRITKAGYDFYVIPQAKITHFEGGSFNLSNKKENEGRLRLGIQSKFLLFEKNYGKQAPEKLYKTDIAFTKGLKILSFGLLSKWAKRRSTIIQEEYEKFRTSRKR